MSTTNKNQKGIKIMNQTLSFTISLNDVDGIFKMSTILIGIANGLAEMPVLEQEPETLNEVCEQTPQVGVVLDSHGMPWDSRINPSSKTMVKATGKWKLIRGIDKATVTAVHNELAELMAITPAPPETAEVITPAPPETAEVITPAPPVDTVEVVTFPQFLGKISKSVADGVITNDAVLTALAKFNIPSVQMLAARPDLIPQLNAELFI